MFKYILISIGIFFVTCQENKKEITIEEKYADYFVIMPGDVQDALIFLGKTDNGLIAEKKIKDMYYSSKSVLLFPPRYKEKMITVRSIANDIRDGNPYIPESDSVLEIPNCSFRRYYYNKTITVDAVFCTPSAPTPGGIDEFKENNEYSWLPPETIASWVSNKGAKQNLTIYRCFDVRVTLNGTIISRNYCSRGGLIVNVFYATNGQSFIVERPSGDPDNTCWIPCSYYNTCSDPCNLPF